MIIPVTLRAQIRTDSTIVTLGSRVLPHVTAVFLLCPQLWHAVCVCVRHCVCGQKMYKSRAKDLLKGGCNELHRPDILTALYQTTMGSKVNKERREA